MRWSIKDILKGSFQIGDANMDKVRISIMGNTYRIPAGLTVQRAFEYNGFQIIRGCGCRGGACGACAMVYRTPQSYKIRTGLACVTLVEEDMMILSLPYFPANKASYRIEEIKPSAEGILGLYPETARCVACNMCTKMCPQDIEVMQVVAAAMKGDITKAAELSSKCVMCGLCSARCTGELFPHLVGLLCRRIYGRHLLPLYTHVSKRLEEIENGVFDEEMERLVHLDKEELRELYRSAQQDKRIK